MPLVEYDGIIQRERWRRHWFRVAPPMWAQDLVIAACEVFNRALPEMDWVSCYRDRRQSRGRALAGSKIIVWAGSDHRDQQITVLHELAHIFMFRDAGRSGIDRGHSEEWQSIALTLYGWAGCTLTHNEWIYFGERP